MLDQNTDRMWYVIGAVLIGAAIIFGMNAIMPNAFASVGDLMTNLTDGFEYNMTVNHGVIGEDIERVQLYDPFEGMHGWMGSTVTKTNNVSFPESKSGVGTRFQGSGGNTTLKVLAGQVVSRQGADGQTRYIYDVEVKNIGDEPLFVADNQSLWERVDPGEFKVIRTHAVPRLAHFQLRLQTETKDGTVDALVGRLDLGKIPPKDGD